VKVAGESIYIILYSRSQERNSMAENITERGRRNNEQGICPHVTE
jgi:hypothetical protein